MRAVVEAVDCPVTMKMRLGWSEDALVYLDVARRAQAAGVQAVTLHARTAKQFYKGERRLGAHRRDSSSGVEIPVIGNGDLDDPHLAMARMRESGVDAIMLGRATLGNPWLISQIARSHGGPRGASVAAAGRPVAFCHRSLPHDGRRAGRAARRSADAQTPRALSQRHSGRGRAARAHDAHRERGRSDRDDRSDDRSPRVGGAGGGRDRSARRSLRRRLAARTRIGDLRELQAVRESAAGAGDEDLRDRPVEVRAQGATIWDQSGKAVSRFCRRLRRLYARAPPSARARRGARAARADVALGQDDVQRRCWGAPRARLAELAPGDLEISFWCNSGTEAIEGAIKLARAATGRAKIVGTRRRLSRKDAGRALGERPRSLSAALPPAARGLALHSPTATVDALDEALERRRGVHRRAGARAKAA